MEQMDIKKLWNILLLLLVANIAFGAEVSGRVLDYGTKKAIDFANVSVEKPSVSGQPSEVRKVMIDGILYIVKDGKMYDARGARVE